MRFLLDTCVLSDFARGDASTLAHIKEVSPEDLAISTVTAMEIEYGLRLNPRLARRLKPVIDGSLDSVHLLPYDRAGAQATAELRAAPQAEGQADWLARRVDRRHRTRGRVDPRDVERAGVLARGRPSYRRLASVEKQILGELFDPEG